MIARFGCGTIGRIGRLPNLGLAALAKSDGHPIWEREIRPNQATVQFGLGRCGQIMRPSDSNVVEGQYENRVAAQLDLWGFK